MSHVEILHPQAVALCGLPLAWASRWDGTGLLKDLLAAYYGFPMLEISGGTIGADGLYSYPEDPDLQPLAKIEFESCVYWQYDYGIVAIVSESETYITRMD